MAIDILNPTQEQLVGVNHVSALVVNPDGLMPLALQWKNRQWSLPKGVMLDGETPVDALMRNLTEETGIAPTRFEELTPIAVADRYSVGRNITHRTAYFMGFTMARGALRPRGKDIKTGEWVSPTDAIERLNNLTDNEVLRNSLPAVSQLARTISAER